MRGGGAAAAAFRGVIETASTNERVERRCCWEKK